MKKRFKYCPPYDIKLVNTFLITFYKEHYQRTKILEVVTNAPAKTCVWFCQDFIWIANHGWFTPNGELVPESDSKHYRIVFDTDEKTIFASKSNTVIYNKKTNSFEHSNERQKKINKNKYRLHQNNPSYIGSIRTNTIYNQDVYENGEKIERYTTGFVRDNKLGFVDCGSFYRFMNDPDYGFIFGHYLTRKYNWILLESLSTQPKKWKIWDCCNFSFKSAHLDMDKHDTLSTKGEIVSIKPLKIECEADFDRITTDGKVTFELLESRERINVYVHMRLIKTWPWPYGTHNSFTLSGNVGGILHVRNQYQHNINADTESCLILMLQRLSPELVCLLSQYLLIK